MTVLSQIYHLVDQWIAVHASELARAGAAIEKPATWGRAEHGDFIDFDKPDVTARLTFWAAGMAEMEVLDVTTSAQLSFQEVSNLSEETLDAWMKQLIR